MKDAIGYLRVSTREQGRSGLGLAAQRYDIEAFGAREGFSIKSWYEDVQTGTGKDALLLRPGLAGALIKARAEHCPLLSRTSTACRETCTSSPGSWSTRCILSLQHWVATVMTSRYTSMRRSRNKSGK